MIKSTSDYSMFKLLDSNREIKDHHVATLMQSLSIKNLMKMNPILVNEKMEIIDGQHRLKACEKLGLEVYYKVQPNLDHEDVLLLQNQRSWNIHDYIKYFAALGNENYKALIDFTSKNSIDIQRYIKSMGNGETSRYIKTGDYKFRSEAGADFLILHKKIMQIVDFIQQRRGNLEKILQGLACYRALLMFIRRKDVDFLTFMDKIETKVDIIGRRTGQHGYYMMFLEIYNFRNRAPLEENYKNTGKEGEI